MWTRKLPSQIARSFFVGVPSPGPREEHGLQGARWSVPRGRQPCRLWRWLLEMMPLGAWTVRGNRTRMAWAKLGTVLKMVHRSLHFPILTIYKQRPPFSVLLVRGTGPKRGNKVPNVTQFAVEVRAGEVTPEAGLGRVGLGSVSLGSLDLRRGHHWESCFVPTNQCGANLLEAPCFLGGDLAQTEPQGCPVCGRNPGASCQPLVQLQLPSALRAPGGGVRGSWQRKAQLEPDFLKESRKEEVDRQIRGVHPGLCSVRHLGPPVGLSPPCKPRKLVMGFGGVSDRTPFKAPLSTKGDLVEAALVV